MKNFSSREDGYLKKPRYFQNHREKCFDTVVWNVFNCAVRSGCCHCDDCSRPGSMCFYKGLGKILVNEQMALPLAR